MSLEICRAIKETLSETLLVPNAPSSVFGVGVGIERNCDDVKETVLGARYHVRVYTDAPADDRILPNVAGAAGFPLQDKFPLRRRMENSDIEIRCVGAPKPRFGVGSTSQSVNTVEDHVGGCKINQSGTFILDDDDNLLNQPIFSGIEIRLEEEGRSGTLGYFVKKGGDFYALSNSHVIAAFGGATVGSDIWSLNRKIATLPDPSQLFQDPNLFKIEFGKIISSGNKPKFFPYKMDAAIAKLDPRLEPKKEILNRGKLLISGTFPDVKNGRTNPEKSYRVTKHGFKTCETGSWIDDVDCDFLIGDPNLQTQSDSDKAKFVKQFRVVRTTKPNVLINNQNSGFADAGDSGSLVFDNKKISNNPKNYVHRAIGLLFAIGTDQFENVSRAATKNTNDYGVVTPISVLKAELSVDFICDLPPASSA